MDSAQIDALIRAHALFLSTSGVRQAEIAKSLAIYTPDLIAENRALQERLAEYSGKLAVMFGVEHDLKKRERELETENADLKRQVTEAVSYILSNEGASMIDCRTCFFVSSCERKPQQCEPNYEMCIRAVRKCIEDSGV